MSKMFQSSNLISLLLSSIKSEHLDKQNNDVRALRAVRNSTIFSLYGALKEGPYRPLRINFLTFNSLVLSGLYSFLNLAPTSLSNPSSTRSVLLKENSGSLRAFLTNIMAGFMLANLDLSSYRSKLLMYLLRELSVTGKGDACK